MAARHTAALIESSKYQDMDQAQIKDLETSLSAAINELQRTWPHQRPLTALAQILTRIEMEQQEQTTRESVGAMAKLQSDAPPTLGKYALGLTFTRFADEHDAFSSDHALLCKGGLAEKKRVLMVIDVQDGYDGGFVSSLPAEAPGGLKFISKLHSVSALYELQSRDLIEQLPAGKKMIRYDKVWNRGLAAKPFSQVTDRVVKELQSGQYDLVVFTYDYLEKSNGEEKGVFAIDDTPWSDPKKPIALVPYGSYLTINAGGLGTNVSERIRSVLPEVTNARGPDGIVNGMPAMYYRKQVDDAFNDRRETSDRTLNEPWLDDVDVDDNGLPKPNAQTLVDKLKAKGFGPDEAELSFCGVVTNRCVASSLLHSVEHGYMTRLLEGGCCAANEAEHAQGLALIREKAGECVEIVE